MFEVTFLWYIFKSTFICKNNISNIFTWCIFKSTKGYIMKSPVPAIFDCSLVGITNNRFLLYLLHSSFLNPAISDLTSPPVDPIAH